MKTILAPTDFSPASLHAVSYAADFARATAADLNLVHVYPPAGSFFMANDMYTDREEQLEHLREQISVKVENSISVRATMLQGNVISQIKKYSLEINPAVIIMGAEGKNARERFLLGGNTISAIRQFSWPLIVAPPKTTFKKFARIGFACDYKNLRKTTPVAEIKSLVKQFDSVLHVLHIGPDRWDDFDSEMVSEASWLRKELEDIKPVYDFARNNNIEEGINRFAMEKGLDLLIIIPKKHGLLNRIFLYSHSRQVILNTAIPVLSIYNAREVASLV